MLSLGFDRLGELRLHVQKPAQRPANGSVVDMRSLLLGSTALLAFGLMAPQASAQVQLNISGSVDAQFGIVDQDQDDDRRSIGGTTDSNVRFDVTGLADNGLEYGARLDLDDEIDATGNEGFLEIDEAYVFVGGDWGEVRLGEKEGQASNLRISVVTVGNGQVDGDFDRYINGGADNVGIDFFSEGDEARISYIGELAIGPGALQFGLSYAPTSENGQLLDNPALEDNNGDFENVWDFAANYTAEFDGGFTVGVSGGLVIGDSEPSGTAEREDLLEWGVGLLVGFDAFTASGFYIDAGDSGYLNNANAGVADDQIRYGASAAYESGPWGVAISWIRYEGDPNDVGDTPSAAGEIEEDVIAGGVAYQLAPGLEAYADVAWFDSENQSGGTINDGVVGLAGIIVSF